MKLAHDLRLQEENGALQGHLVGRAFSRSLMHAEKFKVPANVKDIELVLVLPVDQPRTQAGAPANHLPEFRLTHHLFEKHQVEDLRHVDARVQHVHGNGDLGKLVRLGKLVNGTLGVGHVVVNDFGVAG